MGRERPVTTGPLSTLCRRSCFPEAVVQHRANRPQPMPRSGSLRLRSGLREGLDLSWPRMMIWTLAYASVAQRLGNGGRFIGWRPQPFGGLPNADDS